jgi:plasmid stability protein
MSKSVQIRDVPDDVHTTLRVRAARAGLSLSEYLLQEVTDFARRPTLDEVLDRAATRGGGRLPFKRSVRDVRDDRDGKR